MSDAFNEFGPVVWFQDQFIDASAESLFRLVLLSWLVFAIVLIASDRLGAALLGRSRPLAQHPPVRARAWRWGRRTPPANFSLLPPGVSPAPTIETGQLVGRPLALPAATLQPDGDDVDAESAMWTTLDDADFWRLQSVDERPIFGFENGTRLGKGDAPQRYNPVVGRVETLTRNSDDGSVAWPQTAANVLVIGSEQE